jgi:Aspartyl/Asparaginyl beta-hydroxylase
VAVTRKYASSVALTIRFDVGPLLDDLQRLQRIDWARQRVYGTAENADDGTGGWTVLPLRAPAADPDRTDPGGPGETYVFNGQLARSPAIANLLNSFPCELRSARLMALAPGASVEAHTDTFFGLPYGQVRLHVPLLTNPGATMDLNGVRTHWERGYVWYGDFGLPHAVANDGPSVRVHLVVDCLVNPALRALFPHAEPLSPTLLNRPPFASSARPLAVGTYTVVIDARAFAWSRSGSAEGEIQVPLRVTENGTYLDLPLGVAAALRQVGPGQYRLGDWPEETVVEFAEAGVIVHRQQAGRATRSWQGVIQ